MTAAFEDTRRIAVVALNKRNAREIHCLKASLARVKLGYQSQESVEREADILLRSQVGKQLAAVKAAFKDLGLPTEPRFL